MGTNRMGQTHVDVSPQRTVRQEGFPEEMGIAKTTRIKSRKELIAEEICGADQPTLRAHSGKGGSIFHIEIVDSFIEDHRVEFLEWMMRSSIIMDHHPFRYDERVISPRRRKDHEQIIPTKEMMMDGSTARRMTAKDKNNRRAKNKAQAKSRKQNKKG